MVIKEDQTKQYIKKYKMYRQYQARILWYTAVLQTKKSINELIKINSVNLLSLSTAGNILKDGVCTAQKPKKIAYEQQPKQVQKQLNNKYPEIVKADHNQDADIHWRDEAGIENQNHKV